MHGKRVSALLLAAVLALLSMGAEGCPREGNGKANPDATRYVTPRQGPTPKPNPDTGPGGATPKPVPADPEPEEEHTYSVFASWTPANMTVWLDWQIGRHDTLNGAPFQRSGGSFSQTEKVRHHPNNPPDVFIEINFVKGKGPGRVTCLALKDGQKGPDSEHSLQIIEPARSDNAQGVHCSI
jgi:hypothetical protein